MVQHTVSRASEVAPSVTVNVCVANFHSAHFFLLMVPQYVCCLACVVPHRGLTVRLENKFFQMSYLPKSSELVLYGHGCSPQAPLGLSDPVRIVDHNGEQDALGYVLSPLFSVYTNIGRGPEQANRRCWIVAKHEAWMTWSFLNRLKNRMSRYRHQSR